MLNFDDTRTKEFEKLFAQKDIVSLENFIEKNLEYKKIYDLFKGRFYFDTKDIFSCKISPNQSTVALISLLSEKQKSSPFSSSSPLYNLEILIAKLGPDGNFHRSEQIRYDYSDNMKFVDLEDEAILLAQKDNPKQIIRRFLRSPHNLQSIPKLELLSQDEIEFKKQQLILIRDAYKNKLLHKTQEKQPLRPSFMALEQHYKCSSNFN